MGGEDDMDESKEQFDSTIPITCGGCGKSAGVATETRVVPGNPPKAEMVLVCRACGEPMTLAEVDDLTGAAG